MYQLSGHRLQNFPEKSNVFHFSIEKPETNVDLAIKICQGQPKVMIYTNMMSQSPQCYIPTFIEIDLAVPEKKIF